MAGFVRRLKEFDTVTLLPLETRLPGTYEFDTLIEGNSILSTVYISSLDVGASLLVEYYDQTTGVSEGEFYALDAHNLLTSVGPDRITVTRIHNKPICRATVIGGNVKFSVYITVVSSFASDLDSALVYDGDTFVSNRNKGMPIAGLDTTSNTLEFVEVNDGKLRVELDGDIDAIMVGINKRLFSENLGVLPNVPTSVIVYTVPLGKTFTWLTGNGTADSDVKWIVEIDGVRWLSKRNAYDDRNVLLSTVNPVKLIAGQVLQVIAENKSITGSNCDIETWIYGSENIA